MKNTDKKSPKGNIQKALIPIHLVLLLSLWTACSLESSKVSENAAPLSAATRTASIQSTKPIKPTTIEKTPEQRVTVTESKEIQVTNIPTKSPDDFKILPGTFFLTTGVGHDIKITDILTGAEKRLFKNKLYAEFVEWRNKGCELLISTDDGNLLLVNLDGEVQQKIFEYSELEKRKLAPYGFKVFLSPDDQWLWYWTAAGRPFDETGENTRLEIQNISVIARDLKEGPYHLTSNGGGWVASWSPQGNLIAFTDYDLNKVIQVYVSTYRGEKKAQLTDFNQSGSFEKQGANVYEILWSPDGNKVAVNYSYIENGNEEFATIITDIHNKQVEFQQSQSSFLWWVDNLNFIGRLREKDTESVFSYNLLSKGIGRKITQKYFAHIHPFIYTNQAGFFGMQNDWKFSVLNINNGVVQSIPTFDLNDMQGDWFSTPPEFEGKGKCK